MAIAPAYSVYWWRVAPSSSSNAHRSQVLRWEGLDDAWQQLIRNEVITNCSSLKT
jgi:hypothetical protein